MVSLSGVQSNSERMDWRCWRWDAQSRTSSNLYWEFFLNILQMLSMKAWELPKSLRRKAWKLPRSLRRKALNSDHVIGVALLWRRLCYAHLRLMEPRRNEAANGVRFIPVAPDVSKWSSHC